MSSVSDAVSSAYPNSGPPTAHSTWLALTGGPITEAVLTWPADLFALTDVLLAQSQVYRFVLSPPSGASWPPEHFDSWPAAVEAAGRGWAAWVEDPSEAALPELLAGEWEVLLAGADMPIADLAEGRDWRVCEALLTLHAIADEACAGLGLGLGRPEPAGHRYRARGRELLARNGSLARLNPDILRVLPKVRTSPNATALGSLARYACVHRPGAQVRWSKIPTRHRGSDPQAEHSNLLLLPWPLRIRSSDFHPIEGSIRRLTDEPFGYFEFAPADQFDFDLLERTILAAREEQGSVDVVVFPESAIEESDIGAIEAVLDRLGVTMLIAGVRQPAPQSGRLPGNWVHIGVSPLLEKGSTSAHRRSQGWFHVRQNKHHRWSLDEAQIFQYHLGGSLHPHIRWWEAMEIERRTVQFVELGEDLTLACLVCEDLSQHDDVAEVIQSVGPTLVITPLLDGPQLTSRWAARYASVLADDPGSAVATLSAYGMVDRSRPTGYPPSRVVGLWKDPVRGIREVSLEPGSHGVLMTICGERTPRRTADGRLPLNNAVHFFDVAVQQIQALPSSAASRPEEPAPSSEPSLEVEELTILTGWSQAVAEAVSAAPDAVQRVLDDAGDSAPWRAALNLPAPSARLTEAFATLEDLVRAGSSDGVPTAAALFAQAATASADDDPDVAQLVRRVLRSTLDQRRSSRQPG